MTNPRRPLGWLAAAMMLVAVMLSTSTARAEDGSPRATGKPALVRAAAKSGAARIVAPRALTKQLRPATAKPAPPVLPEEMELLSDIAVRLLSGNSAKLLADICTELFSGNSAECLSGNEAALLSGNTTDLLSGNETELLSGNKPKLFSGNNVQLFSNIDVKIEIANSGNNNGNNGLPPARSAPLRSPPLPKAKKRAKVGALDRDQNAAVSFRELSASKTAKRLRRAKTRFEALDVNGDGVLTLEEFAAQSTGGHSVALQELR